MFTNLFKKFAAKKTLKGKKNEVKKWKKEDQDKMFYEAVKKINKKAP